MKPKFENSLETKLKGLTTLLSHLHIQITSLERSYQNVLELLPSTSGELLKREDFWCQWISVLDRDTLQPNPWGIILVEVDHFEKVLQTHGSPTAREIVRRVAELIRSKIPPHGFVSLVNQNEFAIAICSTDVERLGLAETIRRCAERLHGQVIGRDGKPDSKISWKLTVSAGVASATLFQNIRKPSATEIFSAADEALVQAKLKGRNQVQVA